jgi:hypothetical protein
LQISGYFVNLRIKLFYAIGIKYELNRIFIFFKCRIFIFEKNSEKKLKKLITFKYIFKVINEI